MKTIKSFSPRILKSINLAKMKIEHVHFLSLGK